MQKKITETTAQNGLGDASQAKLFAVPTGVYTGRRVALIQTSANDIKMAWSDSPSSGWSSLATIVSDASNGSFDARMTANGDIHIVYTEQTTGYLVTRKLTFGEGSWSVGSNVTIYNGTQCYDPSLGIAADGDLWVSYSRFVSPNRSIYAKSSTDDGASWGSGVGDAGDQISSTSIFAWSRVVIDSGSVHVIYNDQDTAMSIRSRLLSGGIWSEEYDIATGSGFDNNFDVGLGADGRMGVAWVCGQLYYREYDGSNWGAISVLETHSVLCPQVLFENNIPAVVYLDIINGNMKVARFTNRRAGAFSASIVVDKREAPFDAVLLYDASSASYQDLTSQANSYVAADVYHSSSGCLVKDSDDVVYLGMDVRFRFARMLLSTVGVGGTIQVSYWDGANWHAFTPANGTAALDNSTVDLLFWTDYGSTPVDWQKRIIDSQLRYWVKIEVVSGYATGPVGTQISAASEIDRMIFRR
ncbi:MAG: hypothetical protein NTW07_07350 [candidate division Zixibacteria bacterium]|nr:hypothetical protein [candidate division Zixibacteria bacterium]